MIYTWRWRIVDWTVSSSMKVTKLIGHIFGILNRNLSQTKWKLVQKHFLMDRHISLSSLHVPMFLSLPTTMTDKQMALVISCVTFTWNFPFRNFSKYYYSQKLFCCNFFIWMSRTPHFYSIAVRVLTPSKLMLYLSPESFINILMKTWGRFYSSVYAMSWHFFNKTEYENSIEKKWQPATQT